MTRDGNLQNAAPQPRAEQGVPLVLFHVCGAHERHYVRVARHEYVLHLEQTPDGLDV
eukprot:CAMPEP_0179441434 /NCGR_PEP_ID=MMETSP0799-20121207/24991_1 /TAXON_ID=46947 /ORGANISM="Geminigera cryophila, Strain CCMP2564" /LENGTH=56 /DNA_ID=CAMNT_0021225695 /DNA_START=459 /DNA_END=630 /DNA_ORIENTATION=-